MQRPRDLPAHRGLRVAPNRVVFFHYDAPTYGPSMTEADIEAFKAHIAAALGEEAAREIAGQS